MYESYLYKYKPRKLEDFYLRPDLITTLTTLIQLDTLNIILKGDANCGKTSLLDTIILEYYNCTRIPDSNVLYINTLEEQGISYYRTEVKTFCQTSSHISGKKKFIVIDDIDNINEQCQQVFRNCIDKYHHSVNFISSCNNIQKIAESIQSRCSIIKIYPMGNENLKKLASKIIKNENIKISPPARDFILNISNNSVRILINYIEKCNLYGKNITLDSAKQICTNINFTDFETYLKHLLLGNLKKSIKIIQKNVNLGFSVIDILENLYIYIKVTDIIDEVTKYNIIIIISKYIAVFYSKHEDDIELYFLTYEINKILNKPLVTNPRIK
jgi:DNA polymerase III delta prime subunit